MTNSLQAPSQMGSSFLKSKLPSQAQIWLPEEILRLPQKLTYSHKDLLLRKYGITDLHWASLTGSVEDIGNFLNRSTTINQATSSTVKRKSGEGHEIEGATALFLAARSGLWPSIVEMLLEHGADKDILKPNRRGDTALHAAALSGQASIMKLLLDALNNKGGVDTKGYMKRTPLHYAAGLGHTEVIELLLSSSARKTAKDVNGATPFHFAAAWMKNINALEFLMPDNDVDVTDSKGRTALHYAASKGHIQSMIWLLDHGSNVDAQDSNFGDTPLHVGWRYCDVIRVLTSHKANLWIRNKEGKLPIAIAQENGNAESVKEFIKAIQRKEVDPTIKPSNDDDASLLHYIAGYGSDDALEWIIALLESQDNPIYQNDIINMRDGNGGTATHWAASQGNVHVLKVLVRKKADMFAVDAKGQSALGVAIAQRDNMEFVKAFMELPVVMYQARSRVLVNHEEAARWMKEYYSVHNMQLEAMSMKLKAQLGQKVIQITIDPFEELPPIYLALRAGRDDIAEFMQEHTKDSVPDAVNKRGEITGRTALHWATILKDEDVVRKLLVEVFRKELKPNLEDKDGKTALEYATEMNQGRIERLLMENCEEIRAHMEGLFRDRQLYVDAANAALVASALIASVTFAGWLQPPLNYETYYGLPGSPDNNMMYAAVQQSIGVRVFWVFNSLSFIFSISTVLAGLIGIVPVKGRYISRTVEHLRITVIVALVNLALSIVFVMGAFAAAGFAVLPPIFKYQANMMATVIIGGIPCLLLMGWFIFRPIFIQGEFSRMESLPLRPPPPPPPPSSLVNPSRPWEFDDLVTHPGKRDSKKSSLSTPSTSLSKTDSKRSIPFLTKLSKMDSKVSFAIPRLLSRKESKLPAPLINNFFEQDGH